jgi:hypothetical protein
MRPVHIPPAAPYRHIWHQGGLRSPLSTKPGGSRSSSQPRGWKTLLSGSCWEVSRSTQAMGDDRHRIPKDCDAAAEARQEGPGVVHRFVQSPKGNVKRLANGTARLLILANSFYVELLRSALLQQACSLVGICLSHAKFDAAKKIAPEPVHPNGVLICEVELNRKPYSGRGLLSRIGETMLHALPIR